MKVLITGVAGLLGSHLVNLLYPYHEIIGVDNLIGSYEDNILYNQINQLYIDDCSNLNLMKYICRDVDVIFHTACLPYEGMSIVSPHSVATSVFNTTSAVGTAAAYNKVKLVVNFSSMARYGQGLDDKPFLETDIPKPVDPYGIAKVAGEQLLKNMSELYGYKTITLVPHNVFGIRGKWNDPYRGVIYIMINKILRGEPIVIYGNGEQKRSWTFADDVLSFIPQLLYKYDDIENGEVFNIGTDDLQSYLSINELAQIIQEEIGIISDIEYQENLSNVKYAWCSAEKIKNTFNWNSQKTIREGIRDIILYIKHHGSKEWNYSVPIELDNITYPNAWNKNK